MTKLSKETVERIECEAHADSFHSGSKVQNYSHYQGRVKGALAEAEKAAALVEALERAALELGYLTHQNNCRPGGSVDLAYQLSKQALRAYRAGEGK